MSSVERWIVKIEEVRHGMEGDNPARDDYGYSRAWQVAITKLEEAEMWLQRAQEIEDARANDVEQPR